MSLETNIPKEITEYKEKIMFGLSVRQMIILGIGLLIGVPIFIILQMNGLSGIAGYVLFIIIIPFGALGWYKPLKMNFERYFRYTYKFYMGVKLRPYKTDMQTYLDMNNKMDGENNAITTKQEKIIEFEKSRTIKFNEHRKEYKKWLKAEKKRFKKSVRKTA